MGTWNKESKLKLILLIFLTSCATPVIYPPIKNEHRISPELQPYVAKFFEEYQKHLDIQLADDGNYYDRVEDHIRIKRKDWEKMSPDFREMLCFHEFFHGINARRHLEDKWLADGCPYSVMFHRIDEICWIRHREWYIKEGFSRKFEFTRSGR
jgi:hypothetical protein